MSEKQRLVEEVGQLKSANDVLTMQVSNGSVQHCIWDQKVVLINGDFLTSGGLVCNRLLLCSGMDITGKILYSYGKQTGSSFRILHHQYSTYALRKPVLTLYKSVLGTIEKRTSHFTIAPTTYLCGVRVNLRCTYVEY